jgi:hypothetical protein
LRRKSSVTRSWIALFVSATLLACSASREDEGAALVSRIGASRLAAEVAVLRDHQPEVLQESSWPAAIRELQPQSVRVEANGVFVQRWKAYVEEEGIFIAFSATAVDTSPGREPLFTLIAPNIYWYRIKG